MEDFVQTALVAATALSVCSCGSFAGSGVRDSPPKTVALDPMMAGKSLAGTTYRSTITAAVRQPVTSARQGIAVFLTRQRELVAGNLPEDTTPSPPIVETPGDADFDRLLDEHDFRQPESGSLKWLVDGSEFFGEMDRQIASAQKSIRIKFYIFDNDDIAVRYADKLRKRSDEVDVDVLYDDFGTATAHLSSPETEPPAGFVPPSDMKKYLENGSGVEVRRTLNPWLVADHTKLVLFDNRTAILGGMNIGREYFSEWHDLMVRVEGPVVAELAPIFDRAWDHAGPFGDLTLLAPRKEFPKPAVTGHTIPIRILRTDAGGGRHEILEASLLAIRGAKKRILIENPYFANDDIMLAVRAAAKRGVDVKVRLRICRGDRRSAVGRPQKVGMT